MSCLIRLFHFPHFQWTFRWIHETVLYIHISFRDRIFPLDWLKIFFYHNLCYLIYTFFHIFFDIDFWYTINQTIFTFYLVMLTIVSIVGGAGVLSEGNLLLFILTFMKKTLFILAEYFWKLEKREFFSYSSPFPLLVK